MRSHINRYAWGLLVPAVLAGCRSGYEVDVRNLADQPIAAAMSTTHVDGAGQLLASARLGPGDRTTLFRQTDSMNRVWLEVDYGGNPGHPAMMDLHRGRTVINVRKSEPGVSGRLILEEVPRP